MPALHEHDPFFDALSTRLSAAPAPQSPLDRALVKVAKLDLNPLCSSREHAERLLREDVEGIVRELDSQWQESQGGEQRD